MLIDLLIVVLAAALAVSGYRRGAVLAVSSLGLIALGAGVGLLVGATAGRGIGLVAMGVGAALVAGLLAAREQQFEHAVTGSLPDAWRQLDRPAGAVLGICFALLVSWMAAATASIVPPDTRGAEVVRSSRLGAVLVGALPPTGTVGTMLLRSGLFPVADGPVVLVHDPDAAVVADPQVQAAAASVLRIAGSACGLETTGTGWVVAPGVVATNAHVVAGHEATRVAPGSTAADDPAGWLAATLAGFDPANDIAILAVPGLVAPPLQPRAEPSHGTSLAVLGYPHRSQLVVSPARYDRSQRWPTADIYDQPAGALRLMLFRGAVSPGNSGSPLVDEEGRVVGMVTATALEQQVEGGYAVPVDLVLQLAGQRAPSRPGPCTPAPAAAQRT